MHEDLTFEMIDNEDEEEEEFKEDVDDESGDDEQEMIYLDELFKISLFCKLRSLFLLTTDLSMDALASGQTSDAMDEVLKSLTADVDAE